MRSPGLVVMGVAGLLVVGYAFYTLLSPSPSRTGAAGRSRPEASQAADDGGGENGDGTRKARPRTAAAAKPKRVIDTDRPPSPPPPRPVPTVPLDEARKAFADFLGELDGLATGDVKLTSPEWVELYRRGHDLLTPLQQHLDPQDPDDAQELRTANESMRTKLSAIEPNRGTPPAG
jgi:hypothetical protein